MKTRSAVAEGQKIQCRECGHIFGEDEAEVCRRCHEHICPRCFACSCPDLGRMSYNERRKGVSFR